MFREMRRCKQVLSLEESIDILNRNTSGVLAVWGDDDYPYTVPLSYVYDSNKIYFHTAKSGHKLDAITRCTKVSFCVIDKDEVIQEEYTSYFRSVIVFGNAKLLEEDSEKQKAIEMLAAKYSPDMELAHRLEEIKIEYKAFHMIELDIEHMSGKEAIELVRAKSV